MSASSRDFSYRDISGLVELLDKNNEFKRPDGQVVGYSLQDGGGNTQTSSLSKSAANPLNISLPATVVDQQLRLPIPSESREAKKLQTKKTDVSRQNGYEIWSREELAAAFRERHDATIRRKEGLEEPEHSVIFQETVTTEDVYFGVDVDKLVKGGGSSRLLVKIVMPKLNRLADLAIAVDPYELRVSSSKYYLQASLPQKVVAGKAEAKWDSTKKTLTVLLTVDSF